MSKRIYINDWPARQGDGSSRRAPLEEVGQEPRNGLSSGPTVSSPAEILRRTLPIAMLSLSLIAVPILILEPNGLPRLRALQHELEQVESENDDLRRDVDCLRVEVQKLRDDPSAVERIARGELGMVRKNEVVFQFRASSSPHPE
jgi:cell division protein FtsB